MPAYFAKPPKGSILNRSDLLANGLISTFLLNEHSGLSVYDANFSWATGSLAAGASFLTGTDGISILFSGSATSGQNLVNLGLRNDLNSATKIISVMTRFRAISGTGSATWQQIFGHGSAFQSVAAWNLLLNGNDLRFYCAGQYASVIVGKNVWVTALGTYDGTNVRVYAKIDGGTQLLTSSTANTTVMTALTGTNTAIGRGGANDGTFTDADSFGGNVSIVAVWRRTLSLANFEQLVSDPYRMFRRRRVPVPLSSQIVVNPPILWAQSCY